MNHPSSNIFFDSSILITGVTGTLGQELVFELLKPEYQIKRVVGLSRKWQDQENLRRKVAELEHKPDESHLRLFLGDIRDPERLKMAMNGIDYVVHAAAIKDIVRGQYDVGEILKTNCVGSWNVFYAAWEAGVKMVLFVSSDKGCSPNSAYGTSKRLGEDMAIGFNHYSGAHGTRYAVVRYGNVFGSQGSVFELWREQANKKSLSITHPDMTRFWISIREAAQFVLHALGVMEGGEVFVPHLPTARTVDLARAVAPDAYLSTVGIRPGEKLHEWLISPEESNRCVDLGWSYRISPVLMLWNQDGFSTSGSPVPREWIYSSASATRMTPEEISHMVGM